ncbi:MAG: DUF2851 family protein [Verrucomicrobia bacterium]|nr:DUF2851 family protein [Verrucomicrobiota bacterium]
MDGFPIELSVYARFLHAGRAANSILREDRASAPPSELLLQQIWLHQRFDRDSVRLTDGRRVQVLHPGFWNRAAGPDFQKALVRFEQQPPFSGDVEIDLEASSWMGHGHQQNPLYKRVVLHVIWSEPSSARAPSHPATLVLKPLLDSPLEELRRWLVEAPEHPACMAGKCQGPLATLDESQARALLREAAAVRCQAKAQAITARSRTVGWEQALWEALFAGLGYKANVWPMKRLAELRSEWQPLCLPERDRETIEAILLGMSGFLPVEPDRLEGQAASKARALWQHWWRHRDSLSEIALPRSAWSLRGVRPSNHPQRRLAVAAGWISNPQLCSAVETWVQSLSGDEKEGPLRRLGEILDPETENFWHQQWSLDSGPCNLPQRLLGRERITELAMNAVLPWAWARAWLGGNEPMAHRVMEGYFNLPATGTNHLLRQAELRLFGGRCPWKSRRAAEQQGLLQILRDFCLKTDAVCSECRFPELVKEMRSG